MNQACPYCGSTQKKHDEVACEHQAWHDDLDDYEWFEGWDDDED